MRALLLASLGAVLSSGCGGAGDKSSFGDNGGTSTDSTTSDGGSTDTGEEPDLGQYWALDADLLVAEGQVDTTGSELRVRRLRDLEESCLDVTTLSEAEVVGELPHETIWTWWELGWEADDLGCFAEGVGAGNEPVRLGFGLLHPEIVAALPSSRLVDAPDGTAGLLGAYLQLPGDDRLFVFGAAGSEQAWAGEGVELAEGEVPDGMWWVRSIYSLPLTW